GARGRAWRATRRAARGWAPRPTLGRPAHGGIRLGSRSDSRGATGGGFVTNGDTSGGTSGGMNGGTNGGIGRVVVGDDELRSRVGELGKELTADYADHP